MPTTIDNETELSAVNSILGSIGQSPLTSTSLDYTNPEVGIVYNFLKEANISTQSEGWVFNSEPRVKAEPSTSAPLKHIAVADNILRYDLSDGQIFRTQDVIRKFSGTQAYLYDKVHQTFEFDDDLYLDVVYLYEFEKIPEIFKRYVTSRASVRAATQLVANPELVKLLQQQESYARATCMDYECEQGDYSFMGWGANTAYRPYQPANVLRRN